MLWLVHSTYQKLMHSIQPMVNTVESLNLDTQYQARLPSSPIYEFRVISGAFNNLLDKVQRTNEKLQSENSQLSHQALHDQLTKLPNRHYFSLYTTNFTELLSYQASAFLKLPEFP